MVLTGVREDQIETCLSGLSLDEMDILVKYVYKGLGMPRNNGPLFKWHAKVRVHQQLLILERLLSCEQRQVLQISVCSCGLTAVGYRYNAAPQT